MRQPRMARPRTRSRIGILLRSGHWRAALAMAVVVVGIHLLGLFLLLATVLWDHHHLRASGAFAAGTGLTAYTLGLRHAFDADHISAIDNTTRKLMTDGRRPMSVGLFFSLGHSTVVLALTVLFASGVHFLGALTTSGSAWHSVTAAIGTGISGGFLYLIAAVNLVILCGIVQVFVKMRQGRYDDAQLEAQLSSRGLLARVLGRFTKMVSRPWHMYPVGILFGLGFDTASEVALLLLAAGTAGAGLPFYAILCLPVLFAAGMSLFDTIDGSFMNFAYGWAFSNPVRKVFYNIVVTGLSVAMALVIGTVELGGLFARQLALGGPFWSWFENFNINALGVIVVGMFAATWAIAASVWRFARVEERWESYSTSRLEELYIDG